MHNANCIYWGLIYIQHCDTELKRTSEVICKLENLYDLIFFHETCTVPPISQKLYLVWWTPKWLRNAHAISGEDHKSERKRPGLNFPAGFSTLSPFDCCNCWDFRKQPRLNIYFSSEFGKQIDQPSFITGLCCNYVLVWSSQIRWLQCVTT